MQVVRDVLDRQVVDRGGARLGKVDGVVIQVIEGRPPRVVAIEIGAVTCAARVWPRLGRWLELAVRRWSLPLGMTRIPWHRVRRVAVDVHVDVESQRTRVATLERWLRTRVVDRIPWSK